MLAGACNKNGLSSGTADPANTVEAWIPVGGWINFNNRSLVLTDQKLFKAAAVNQLEFTKGVSVRGLGVSTRYLPPAMHGGQKRYLVAAMSYT